MLGSVGSIGSIGLMDEEEPLVQIAFHKLMRLHVIAIGSHEMVSAHFEPLNATRSRSL